MTDPRDPLAGLDPYPRELIDTLGLHPERADLLEDIVSTPGPARPTTARTRALLAVGVAAAVAVIGGGWFLASSHSGHDETPVAAVAATTATESTTAPTTAPATAPTTAPASATGSPTSGVGGAKLDRCLRVLTRDGELRRVLPLLRTGRNGRIYVRSLRGKRYAVVVRRDCTIRALRSLSVTRR